MTDDYFDIDLPVKPAKRQISPLTYWSALCFALIFICMFFEYICVFLVVGLLAPVLAIAALIHIQINREYYKGRLIPILILLIYAYGMAMILVTPRNVTASRQMVQSRMQLYQLNESLQYYINATEGKLPPAENWCDVLVQHGIDPNTDVDRNPLTRPDTFDYAFNKAVSEFEYDELPARTVLFFESEIGWNSSGGKDKFSGKKYSLYNYYFFKDYFGLAVLKNGEIVQIPHDELDAEQIVWFPDESGSAK